MCDDDPPSDDDCDDGHADGYEAAMKALKLYVWRHVLTDYTSGIAVAAATSVDEARGVLLKAAEDWEQETLGGDIAGDPDDVLDLPGGAYCWGGG